MTERGVTVHDEHRAILKQIVVLAYGREKLAHVVDLILILEHVLRQLSESH